MGVTMDNIICAGGMPAFIAAPDAKNVKFPCIVLLHERYGLVQHTKDLAARFAAEGYACITPDLFFMHPDQDALHKGDASCEPTDPAVAAQIDAAIDAAIAAIPVDTDRIAVMGVCQTARYALVAASRRKIAAALCWYGAAQPREWQVNERFPVGLDELIAKTNCPVLGMFGEKDHIISIDDVRKLRASLETHGRSYQIEVFPGAPHGWLNDTMPGRYRREQAEAAWAAQASFLKAAFAPARGDLITQSFKAGIARDYDFKQHVRFE